MKILIIYASKHGSTEKAVNSLKEKITHETIVVNLKKVSGLKETVSKINYETIQQFANRFN